MVKFKPIESLTLAEVDELRRMDELVRIAYAASEIQKICAKSPCSQFFPYVLIFHDLTGGEGYKSSVRHYLESSSEIAYAAVQPGRAEDLSKIIKVLGITKAPFAIKGGGHATNPHFSSTKGIQISMARFNKVHYHEDTGLLDVGAGCLFDEVYRALRGTGRNIVGGSGIFGVGVAGWLLGGGYSLKTNQYGLGIDTVLGIKIVLPNGDIDYATKDYNSILLNAVRGGGNNFGIVTEFTFATHPQPSVFGGILEYETEEIDDVKDAVDDFVKNYVDPKASILAAFRYFNKAGGKRFKLTVQYFYDGPQPSPSPFQKFFNIPHTLVLADGAGAGQEHPDSDTKQQKANTGPQQQQPPKSNLMYFDFDLALSELKATSPSMSLTNKGQTFSVDDLYAENPPSFDGFDGREVHGFLYEAEHKTVINVNDLKRNPAVPPQCFSRNDQSGGRFGNGSLFVANGLIEPDEPVNETPMEISAPLRSMFGVGENARGRWGTVMVSKYTREIIDEVERQAKKAASHLVKHSGKFVLIDIWPFHPQMFDRSDHEAAWPHKTPNGPLLVYFQWEDEENDAFWIEHMKRALAALEAKVYGPGKKPDTPVYCNTSLFERTTVQDIYRENLVGLSKFRRKVDPEGVMHQTGGFKIP